MKYIVLETEDGQSLPILFPECLTHCFVAGAMQLVVDTLDPKKDLRPKQLDRLLEHGSAKVVSAGFAGVASVSVHGESESLGGVKSKPSDEARILMGDTAGFIPDSLLMPMLERLKAED